MNRRSEIIGSSLVIVILSGIALLIWLLTSQTGLTRPQAVVGLGAQADPWATYDPVKSGDEDAPRGFRQLIARDGITPIYDPTFVSAAESEWPEDALVIGVEIDGDARAYPVSHLNSREMVIDSIAGIPVLVTW